MPPASDEERGNKAALLGGGVHVVESDAGVDDDVFLLGIPELKTRQDVWICLNARAAKDLAKVKLFQKQSNEVTTAMVDPCSIEECMDVPEPVDVISDESYFKVLEQFKDTYRLVKEDVCGDVPR